jgi:triacylglycerol esterase/lipase EstA (alpha/beta hydrolase family)
MNGDLEGEGFVIFLRVVAAVLLLSAMTFTEPVANAEISTSRSQVPMQHQNGSMAVRWAWANDGFWNIDQRIRIEEKARQRFWAQQVRWAGTNVVAYIGLQTGGRRGDSSIGDTAIFSAWNADAARGPNCSRFNEEGSGYSCRIAYPIAIGDLYRLRIWRLNADAMGQWWGVWVKNESTGREKAVGSLRLPPSYSTIAAVDNFVDYSGAKVACAQVDRSAAVFGQPTANSHGPGKYEFAGRYVGTTKGTCVTGSSTRTDMAGTRGIRLVSGGRASTATPVILVHGMESDSGVDCEKNWGDLLDSLRELNWTGTLAITVYYAGDTRCPTTGRRAPLANIDIGEFGDHGAFHSSGHVKRNGAITGHSTDARIRHLAYHWAWMVYERFTRDLRPVKAVGHSMGGLIIRSAMREVQAGNPLFPPRLLVEDVVTLGTPHVGARLANACAITHEQCRDLRPDSGFLNDLTANGQNPQGDGGTEWTAIGAHEDNLVTPGSATSMAAAEKLQYGGKQGMEHERYMHKKIGSDLSKIDAKATVWHFGRKCSDFPRHWPIAVTYLALRYMVDDDC